MGRASFTVWVLGALVVMAAAPVRLAAQDSAGAPASAAHERLSSRELDSLLAPVALYPDPLLASVLMAATYPRDVTAAAAWMSTAANASLRGEALAFALETFDWDPSVKTLAQFPSVLALLDGDWDWMVRVGNAFLLQESEVMDSLQRLRHQAYAMGTLRSTAHQRVRFDGGAVIIEMIDPATVHIPAYDPGRVYGYWSYPEFPPHVFRRPMVVTRYVVVPSLWGWSSWEWHRHRLRVDRPRFDHPRFDRPRHRDFDRHRPWRFDDETWRRGGGRPDRPDGWRRDGDPRDEWRGDEWRGDERPRGGWRPPDDGRRGWTGDERRRFRGEGRFGHPGVPGGPDHPPRVRRPPQQPAYAGPQLAPPAPLTPLAPPPRIMRRETRGEFRGGGAFQERRDARRQFRGGEGGEGEGPGRRRGAGRD